MLGGLAGLASLFHTFDLRSNVDRVKLANFPWDNPLPNPHPERHRQFVQILLSTMTAWNPIFTETTRLFRGAEDVIDEENIEILRVIMAGQGWAAVDENGNDLNVKMVDAPKVGKGLTSEGILLVGVILCIGLPRLYQMSGGSRGSRAVFVGDVIVWYLASSIYLSSCANMVMHGITVLQLVIITTVQVGCGGILAYAADTAQLLQFVRNPSTVSHFLCAGLAYFGGSLFALDALRYSSVPMVAGLRTLEAISTCAIMAALGSLAISRTQGFAIALVVAGAFLTAFGTDSASWIAISRSSMVAVFLLLMSNLMYSTRNLVATKISLNEDISSSTMTIFAGQNIVGFSLGLLCISYSLMVRSDEDVKAAWFQIDKEHLLISSISFTSYNP